MNAYDLCLYLLKEQSRFKLEYSEYFKKASALSSPEAVEYLNNCLVFILAHEFPMLSTDEISDLLENPKTQEALSCTYFKEFYIEH